MKSAVFATLLTAAAAFAPVKQQVASTTALAAFDDELGVQAPVSEVIFAVSLCELLKIQTVLSGNLL